MMNLKIDYSKEICYPPMMQDIIRQLCILEKEFTEITIWYGDGFDYVIYADEDTCWKKHLMINASIYPMIKSMK